MRFVYCGVVMSFLYSLLLAAASAANAVSPEYLHVQVSEVRVATTRPGSDQPWTTTKQSNSDGCDLLSVIPGIPGIASKLCGAMGQPASQAHAESAPDIFVRISAGKATYRSYIVRKSYSHKFGFDALIPAGAIPRTGLVVEVVADDGKGNDDTKETIGSFRFDHDTLVDAAAHGKVLGGTDGGVQKLELMVEPWDGKAEKGQFELQVVNGMQAANGIEILAGQVLETTASGSYRMTGNPSPLGPTGIVVDRARQAATTYPDEPFKSGRLGAAIVRVGSGGSMKGALVYSCTALVAPYSGALVLGVNVHPTKALAGTLSFDYVIRPATVEEWRGTKAPSCSAPGVAQDASWPSGIEEKVAELINGRPTLARELLGLTHPTGKNPSIGTVKAVPSQGAQAVVEIELAWSGGFTRTPYVSRITWEFDRNHHIQTTVRDEGGVTFHVDSEHKRRLDAFFRDQMYPGLK